MILIYFIFWIIHYISFRLLKLKKRWLMTMIVSDSVVLKVIFLKIFLKQFSNQKKISDVVPDPLDPYYKRLVGSESVWRDPDMFFGQINIFFFFFKLLSLYPYQDPILFLFFLDTEVFIFKINNFRMQNSSLPVWIHDNRDYSNSQRWAVILQHGLWWVQQPQSCCQKCC